MSLLQRQLFGTGLEPSPPCSSVSYVACHLSQQNLLRQQAWGLWISFGDDSSSLVVGALHPTFGSLLQWAWVTATQPEPRVLTNQDYGSNFWKSYFGMLPRVSGSGTLLAGDVILTINGLPISSFGNKLTNVTDYLQRCNDLFLVAVRSSNSSKASQPHFNNTLVWGIQRDQTTQTVPPMSIPVGFSLAINSLIPHSPSATPRRMPQGMLRRVVTPPKAETSRELSTNDNHLKSEKKLGHKAACTKRSSQRRLRLAFEAGKNPMFRKPKHDKTSKHRHLEFVDNEVLFDPEELVRSKDYMLPIDSSNFQPWLQTRKQKWRSKWKIKAKLSADKTIDIIASLSMPTEWTNPMFPHHTDMEDNKDDEKECNNNVNDLQPAAMPYCDNITFDPYDGSRKQEFIFPVSTGNFGAWLKHRKWKWRSRWKFTAIREDNTDINNRQWGAYPSIWTNPMFAVPEGDKADGSRQLIPYEDNFLMDYPNEEESGRFLQPINESNWSNWLIDRKQKWRRKWKPYPIEEDEVSHQHSMCERLESSIRYDFWADRYSSFDSWLKASTDKWQKSYSWNSQKRKRIQQVCEEVVQFPTSEDPVIAQQQLQAWLRVRKNQWRMLRRKRQRRWEEEATLKEASVDGDSDATAVPTAASIHTQHSAEKLAMSDDYLHIDALLEEEERKKQSLAEQKKRRQPIDLSLLFIPALGLSDDLAAHCLQYLDPSEHGKLLCISKSLGEGLKSRAYMWQLLCNRCPHWHFPRRPRKPWYKLYLSKLRTEVFASHKQWDDMLTNIAEVLFKGDQLKLVKKLIEGAEKKFSFTIDYVSGVVCERNSILNLAVIHKRKNVVHWLVEQKNANIETSDRGHFTPLINAAWGGDKHLVRFLLHHGADRSKVGTCHYTEALAPHFEGLTAEGWAHKKGHDDIAELIRVGL